MRALIASSATGGHIYPALAIAQGILARDPGAEILFVGAKWEIGKDIVGASGFRQVFINVSGFDRKNPLKNIAVIVNLMRASVEINGIIRDFRPDVCIGTGGHVAGPVIRAANRAGIRTIIQEQNVVPGVANKLAEKYADKVFVGFAETMGSFKDMGKVVVSGNPVRAAFAEAAGRRVELREKYGISDRAFCVLFFGGSQGAGAINDAAVEMVRRCSRHEGWHIVLVTGRQLYDGVMERIEKDHSLAGSELTVVGYSDEMHELYAAADLIVSRAGALTVAEIMTSGKASILVPSPNVTNNHQYYNAKALSDAGGALLASEDEALSERLFAEIERLKEAPDAVRDMGRRAHGLARPGAAGAIVDEIYGKK